MRFNTAISAMMILAEPPAALEPPPREAVREARAAPRAVRAAPRRGALAALGHEREPSPTSRGPRYDEALCVDDVVEIAVQVNGKVRGSVVLARDADEAAAREAALAGRDVVRHVGGKPIKKFVYVPGRIMNVIV